MSFSKRLLTLLVALDHLALALGTLGNCVRGETISAALWSMDQEGKFLGVAFRPVVDMLFFLVERQHCQASWLAERYLYEGQKA